MIQIRNKLILTCEQVSQHIIRETEEALDFKTRTQMKLHLMVCKFCRLFKTQNEFLEKGVKNLHQQSGNSASSNTLTADTKEAMQQALDAATDQSA